jgi:hypothetical protein
LFDLRQQVCFIHHQLKAGRQLPQFLCFFQVGSGLLRIPAGPKADLLANCQLECQS